MTKRLVPSNHMPKINIGRFPLEFASAIMEFRLIAPGLMLFIKGTILIEISLKFYKLWLMSLSIIWKKMTRLFATPRNRKAGRYHTNSNHINH